MADTEQEVGDELKKNVVEDGFHTYKLVIPKALFAEIQRIAVQDHTSVLMVIRRYLNWGLVLDEVERNPNTKLIVRLPGEPDEVLRFLPKRL